MAVIKLNNTGGSKVFVDLNCQCFHVSPENWRNGNKL